MRKKALKLISFIFALTVMTGCMFLSSANAQNTFSKYKTDKNGIVYVERVRIDTGYSGEDSIAYLSTKKGCRAVAVKSNNKNLIVKLTNNTTFLNPTPSDYGTGKTITAYNASYISFYAKKAGTYKVTVTFKNAKDQKIKKTLTVYAKKNNNVIKSINFSGKKITDYSNILSSKDSGKLKITLNKDFKLKKIEYATTYDNDGNPKYKKFTNGTTLKLAKTTKFVEHQKPFSMMYDSTIENSTYNNTHNYILPVTHIKVTYYDKCLKTNLSEEFTILYLK